MCSKLSNGRILHKIVDITKNKGGHTLSQQGDSYIIFDMTTMSYKLDEFLREAEEIGIYKQWYDMELT